MKTLKDGPNVVVRLRPEVATIYHVDYDRIPGPWEWLRRQINPFLRRDGERIPSILDVIIECMLVGRQHDPSVEPTDILIDPDLPARVQWTAWSQHPEILQSAYARAMALIRSCWGQPGCGAAWSVSSVPCAAIVPAAVGGPFRMVSNPTAISAPTNGPTR